MEILEKYFDDFTIKSRVMPGLIIVLPLIPYSMVKGLINSNLLEDGAIYSLMFIVLTVILASASRNQGKKKEKKMYKKLGAMPTTIIMRFSDNTLSYKSKVRYHKILNALIPDLNLPITKEEEENISDVDERYNAAIDWLRSNANRDKEKYHLVYKELRDYNLSRNLYGLKNLGIIIYFFIGIREVLVIKNFSLLDLIIMPYPQYVSLLFMVCGVMIVLALASKKNMKNRAYDYAKALVETCENLDSSKI